MAKNFSIFISSILALVLLIQFGACHNYDQEEFNSTRSGSANVLVKYGNIHNAGLDYIRLRATETSNKYTKQRLISEFDKWAILQYGNACTDLFLRDTDSLKNLIIDGTIPSLIKTSGVDSKVLTDHVNIYAQQALTECVNRMSTCLTYFDKDKIFDNPILLEDLHTIIVGTYDHYSQKCESDTDAKALIETLGTLYGSVEYWTNSSNVKSWSKISMEKDKPSCKEQGSEKKTTLTVVEYILVIAGADGIGAAFKSGHLAVILSGAAALYFDVE